ncbi:MAG: sigma 54-interacting transcriptional regulator, partial [Hyphomicrobium sp.]|nr:sigma 54-interacting transcriptional regulator [Hyphomicrobium sp.]
ICSMTIKVGDRLPNATFRIMTSDGPKPKTTDEVFKGKKVALFGMPGAFTGATRERPGIIAEADGGTLFLDEVDAMAAPVQAKLLRTLETRHVRPLGGNQEVAVDFRLISATNANLEEAVQRGVFRRDLYHRLRVLSVVLPPLRDRLGDIPVLAEAFLQRYARAHRCPARRFAPGAFDRLAQRPWPGNVRELENLIEEAVILCPGDAVEIDFPSALSEAGDTPAERPPSGAELKPLDEVEHDYVAHVLRSTGGNKAKAARILRIDYKTLLRKLAETT